MNTKELNKVKLKIKALSLAEESRIIRKLEKGCIGLYGHNPIYHHRVWDVRIESRATHLARAFLSGKKYSEVEPKRKVEKEYHFWRAKARAIKIITKYGSNVNTEELEKWFNY